MIFSYFQLKLFGLIFSDIFLLITSFVIPSAGDGRQEMQRQVK